MRAWNLSRSVMLGGMGVAPRYTAPGGSTASGAAPRGTLEASGGIASAAAGPPATPPMTPAVTPAVTPPVTVTPAVAPAVALRSSVHAAAGTGALERLAASG